MLYYTKAVVYIEKVVEFIRLRNRNFLGNFNKSNL